MTEEVVALQHDVRSSSSRFQFPARLLQLFGDELFVRQNGLVLGGQNFVGQIVQGVVSFRSSLLRAEDEAHWRVLAWLYPMLTRVVEIEVHLAGVGVAELANLQVCQKQA